MLGLHVPAQLPRIPPIWREGRTGFELAGLVRDPVFRDVDPGTGANRPVLLIPGFLAGDGSLGVMTGWLRRSGYRTSRAGMRSNIACSSATIAALEERLEAMVERYGQRAAIIGQSRGGSLGRALAVRRPDLVGCLVALGSPQTSMLAVHPFVLLQVGVVGALGTAGARGMFNRRCLRGECCADFRASFAEPVPDSVRYVSIYSRTDGIVDWHSCLDPYAEHVEVKASHIGMAVNSAVYREIRNTLGGWKAERRRRDRGRGSLPLAA
jgi:triacylglycerol lipase